MTKEKQQPPKNKQGKKQVTKKKLSDALRKNLLRRKAPK